MSLTPTAAALHVGTLVHHLLTPLADRTLPKRHHGYGSTELALLAPGPAGLALTGPGSSPLALSREPHRARMRCE